MFFVLIGRLSVYPNVIKINHVEWDFTKAILSVLHAQYYNTIVLMVYTY
jgi:hypothetical protein